MPDHTVIQAGGPNRGTVGHPLLRTMPIQRHLKNAVTSFWLANDCVAKTTELSLRNEPLQLPDLAPREELRSTRARDASTSDPV